MNMSTASHAIKDIINERSRVRHKKRGDTKCRYVSCLATLTTGFKDLNSTKGNSAINCCCFKKRNLLFCLSSFWFVISSLIWQVMDRSLKSQIMIYHTSKVIIIIHLLIWSHHQELFVQELIHHQRLTLTQVISGHYFGWGSYTDGDFPYQSISN